MNKSPVCHEIPGIHHYIYIMSSIMNKSPVCLEIPGIHHYIYNVIHNEQVTSLS